MEHREAKTHTTINLSSHLIEEAQQIFKEMSKTEIIHEALRRMLQAEKMEQHVKKWKKKGSFRSL